MTETLDFGLDAEELEVFCQEADELIQQLDADLLALEEAGENPEVIQRVFRAAHTLKGSAGAIGHQRMADLTHSMETALDLVRQGRLNVLPDFADLLLNCTALLRDLNEEVRTGRSCGAEPIGLIEQLKAAASQPSTPTNGTGGPSLPGGVPTTASTGELPEVGPNATGLVRVTARMSKDSIAPGVRALQVLMTLDECGQVVWSEPARTALENGEPADHVEALVATTAQPGFVTEQLIYIGEIDDLHVIAEPTAAERELAAPETTAAGEEHSVELPEADTSTAGRGRPAASSSARADVKTVRTSVERLDKLMNLVGELVTDRNRLMQSHSSLSAQFNQVDGLSELAQAISHLAGITDELQEEVMRARMLPLEHVFNKFPRMVRDLARDAGKKITLEIQGQDTELDRSVIEEISDPLMHLLRNSVDHGIEPPEDRHKAGKPESGLVRLAGRSEGNHIVITVTDDGRGINADAVRRSAVAKKLISEEAAARLSEIECLDLIFLPGLSTAKKVTDVSGRGVGMDVVRSNIERLHGSVQVRTAPGKGTVFELRLPLTLAIMPVLLVNVCDDIYCVPLSSVTEVLKINPQTIHRIDGGELVMWRKRTLPLLRLRGLFGLEPYGHHNGSGQENGHGTTLSVVAARWGEENVGLVVDQLLGQQEIVIKSLGKLIGQVSGVSGAAILGDGTVALIVDVPGLVKLVTRERNPRGANTAG
jgi:two-component system chemotaxis sensor kinase CheA